nr:toll/interleukin-1 receptor domain-containing protein [Micromonospora sp. DSM 115978]
AEWVAGQLREAGYEPLLEAWHAVAGVNRTGWLDGALTSADRVLLVLSETYLDERSPAAASWHAAFSPSENRLIPVKVRACTPRGLLANLVTVDLVGLEEEDAASALREGLRAVGTGSASPAPEL